jgi:hypothetical protein
MRSEATFTPGSARSTQGAAGRSISKTRSHERAPHAPELKLVRSPEAETDVSSAIAFLDQSGSRRGWICEQESGSGLCGRRPKYVKIDVEIGVNQAMTHPDHGSPWNVRVLSSRLCADLARGLADDLERVDQGEGQHFVTVEVFPAPPLDEPNR